MGLWLRSVAAVGLSYGLMLAMGVLGAPVVLWRERWTRAWNKLWIGSAFWLHEAICGLRVEIRGEAPARDAVLAANHQSFLDILAIYRACPEPRFVMKRSLLWVPVLGLYARRSGAVPIDRRGGQGTTRRLVEAFRGVPGQIVVYPEGTRVPPGERVPYKRGASVLAAALGLPVALAATNGGVFWPRRGILRRPGVAVVAFLGTLPKSRDAEATHRRLEARIRDAAGGLLREAGGSAAPPS